MPGKVGLERRVVVGQRIKLHLAVVAVTESLQHRAQPRALEASRLEEGFHEIAIVKRERGQRPCLSGKLPRVVQCALEDEPGDRVDVHRRHLAAEPHRLQRDRASTGKRIQHLGRAAAIRLANFLPEPVEIGAVLAPPMENPADGLLLHLLRSPPADLLPLDLLDDVTGHPFQDLLALFRVTRVEQQRRNERRPARRQRPPGRPDMQRRDVPVPNVLLVDRVERDLLDRKRDLDQAGVVKGHDVVPSGCSGSGSMGTKGTECLTLPSGCLSMTRA